jgi:hypothetical protein
MDKSIYTFTLGEKEVALTFNWGAVKRLKNILNADPISEFGKLKDGTAIDIVEFGTNVITACGELSKDEAAQLMDSLTPIAAINVAKDVIEAFDNAFKSDGAGGETGKDTQPKKAA